MVSTDARVECGRSWVRVCCFFSQRAALRGKSKGWLALNHNNMSEWSDMSTHRLLFQWACTMKKKSIYKACWPSTKWTPSSSHRKLTCSRHDILLSWRYINNNHSLIIYYISPLFYSQALDILSIWILHKQWAENSVQYIWYHWTLLSAHCLCYIHMDKTSSACVLFLIIPPHISNIIKQMLKWTWDINDV